MLQHDGSIMHALPHRNATLPCHHAATPHRHTTQGVNVEPYTIVDGPQDWKAADLKGEENAHKWQYRLTEQVGGWVVVMAAECCAKLCMMMSTCLALRGVC